MNINNNNPPPNTSPTVHNDNGPNDDATTGVELDAGAGTVTDNPNNTGDPTMGDGTLPANTSGRTYIPISFDHMFANGRELPFLLPDIASDWKWQPDDNEDPQILQQPLNERNALFYMSDFTLALPLGVEDVWPNTNIKHGYCSIHAWRPWHPKHRASFTSEEDYKKYHPLMGKDIGKLRLTPHIHLVVVMMNRMLAYWRDEYGQGKVAEEWYESWGEKILTFIQMNTHSFLGSGLPNHNNNLEGQNSGDKTSFKFRKKYCAQFSHDLANRLKKLSVSQDVFNFGLHEKVHNREFYHHCEKVMRDHKDGVATFLGVTFKPGRPFPRGTLLIASNSYIEREIRNEMIELRESSNVSGNSPIKQGKHRGKFHQAMVKSYIASQKYDKDYRFFIYNCEHDDFVDLNFPLIYRYSQHFHILYPIVATNDYEEKVIERFVKCLEENELKPIPVDQILAKKENGLVSCSCPEYMRYTWCAHSFTFAWMRGIITDYHRLMDPRPSTGVRTVGRKRNAVRGDPYSME